MTPGQTAFDAALQTLQTLTAVLILLATVGPMVVGFVFWTALKHFPRKEEMTTQFNTIKEMVAIRFAFIDDQLKDDEKIQNENEIRMRVLEQRFDKFEAKIDTKLENVQRDLDVLLDRKRSDLTERRSP